jgi:predicted dehydrogenase
MTDTVRIGIIGAGIVARDMHLPVLSAMPQADIAWVCDLDAERARQLAGGYSIGSVYAQVEHCPDVDVALVAVPVGARRALMPLLLNRGWNLLCEKPFAVTLQDHDDYLALARTQGREVGVGLLRRYAKATVAARRIIRERTFGSIVRVWASDGSRAKRTGMESGWYMNRPSAAGGGILAETGSHLLDQLGYIVDGQGFRLEACRQTRYGELDIDTIAHGTLTTGEHEDVPCCFQVSRLHDLCNGIFVAFADVTLRCGLGFEGPLEIYAPGGSCLGRIETPGGATDILQAVYLEWSDFIAQCLKRIPSAISAETTRLSTSMIEQCYRAGGITADPVRAESYAWAS